MMSDISHTSYVPIPTQGFSDDVTVLTSAHMQTLENGIIKNDAELGNAIPVVNELNDMFEDKPDERIKYLIYNTYVQNGTLVYASGSKRTSSYTFTPPSKYLKVVPGAVGSSGSTAIHGCIDGVWYQNVYGNISTTRIIDTSQYDMLCFQMITTSAAQANSYPTVYSQTLSRTRDMCTESRIMLTSSDYVEGYAWSNRMLTAEENSIALKKAIWVKAGDIVEYVNPTYSITIGIFGYEAKALNDTCKTANTPAGIAQRTYVCPTDGLLVITHKGEGVTAAQLDQTVIISRTSVAKQQALMFDPDNVLQNYAAQNRTISYGALPGIQTMTAQSVSVRLRQGLIEIDGTSTYTLQRSFRLYDTITYGNGNFSNFTNKIINSGVFFKAGHSYRIHARLLSGTALDQAGTSTGWNIRCVAPGGTSDITTRKYNRNNPEYKIYEIHCTADREFCLWIQIYAKSQFCNALIALWIEDITISMQSDITCIAPEDGDAAHTDYTTGSLLMQGGLLYEVTSPIASGAAITPGTNVQRTSVAEKLAELEARIAALES